VPRIAKKDATGREAAAAWWGGVVRSVLRERDPHAGDPTHVRLLGGEETTQPAVKVGRQLLGLAGRLQHRPGREAWKMKTRAAAWTGPNTPSVVVLPCIQLWQSSFMSCSS
jgi:hypothetical protein